MNNTFPLTGDIIIFMDIHEGRINRYSSILYRSSRSYYDAYLSKYSITSGLPIFMLRIKERPGLTILELAKNGRFDKATTTRAVAKLQARGFVYVEADETDKRTKHIYLTAKADPIIEECINMLNNWNKIITEDLSEEEQEIVTKILRKMSDNAYNFLHPEED